MTIGI